jgi:A/G-specific adenine glycosylase
MLSRKVKEAMKSPWNPREKSRMVRRVLDWYRQARRDLPWRRTKDPYRIWVSEIMLQQTQVIKVIPYYEAFIKYFPTVEALAKARPSAVQKVWSGLGYYRRATQMQEAAKIIVDKYEGRFPKNFDNARALPGLGRYTAGAILSIAYGQDLPVVDGNVQRVISRLAALAEDVKSAGGQNALWDLAEELLPRGQAGDFNQALMELGARICTPRNPSCLLCPMSAGCRARQEGDPTLYPFKGKKVEMKECLLACCVISRGEKILLVHDIQARWYADLLRLPFYEITSERIPRKHLAEKIEKDFGLEVQVGEKLGDNRFTITNHKIRQTVVQCEVSGGKMLRKRGRRTQWVTSSELLATPLPASQKGIPLMLL